MESVLRGLLVYVFLLIIFRITGKRSIAQITTFDFVLLLIIAETTQQALLGDDFSAINCFLLILTLFVLDFLLAQLKRYFPAAERAIDGVPVILVRNGRPIQERMARAEVDEAEVLAAAREKQGLARMDQIEYAVLECSGGISVIPKKEE
jgi:uncharacterized membrane protein YcaP (DUF421 family)